MENVFVFFSLIHMHHRKLHSKSDIVNSDLSDVVKLCLDSLSLLIRNQTRSEWWGLANIAELQLTTRPVLTHMDTIWSNDQMLISPNMSIVPDAVIERVLTKDLYQKKKKAEQGKNLHLTLCSSSSYHSCLTHRRQISTSLPLEAKHYLNTIQELTLSHHVGPFH